MSTLAFPALDAAIGQAEGYGTAGSIPTLANNPGDLVAGPFSTAHGATGALTAAGGQQIATFANPAAGTAAEDALVANNYTGGDINALAASWLSGSTPAQQASWASNVSSALNVPASTSVASLAGVGTPASTSTSSSTLGACGGSITSPSTWAPAVACSLGLTTGRIAAWGIGAVLLIGGIFMLAIGGVLGGVESALGTHQRITNVVSAARAAAGL